MEKSGTCFIFCISPLQPGRKSSDGRKSRTFNCKIFGLAALHIGRSIALKYYFKNQHISR